MEKSVKLSAEIYQDVFNGHLEWINTWKTKHPQQWHTIAEDLGKAAVYMTFITRFYLSPHADYILNSSNACRYNDTIIGGGKVKQ
jgi:hypothetical protein